MTLSFQEVVNISSHSNTLLVRRDQGDTVIIGSGWTPRINQTIDAVNYNVFTQGAVTLGVEDNSPTVMLSVSLETLTEANAG
ncbi:MAG: hypothetical protein IAG10_11255 [Planctomycetaceae bacterium]|nr:hypothetical protein [Planctomycetaceae bacterium]